MMLPVFTVATLFLLASPVIAQENICARDAGCAALAEAFPGKFFVPGDAVYTYENAQFWSNTEILSPLCIFRPNTTADVSNGIIALAAEDMQFAIRGGEHMSKLVSKHFLVRDNKCSRCVYRAPTTSTMVFLWFEQSLNQIRL